MRAAVSLPVYGLAVVLAAGLLAPPLFHALHAAGAEPDFDDVVQRLMEGLALLGLWPLMRSAGLGGRRPWGYGVGPRTFGRELMRGGLVGVATLGVLAAALVALGVRVADPDFAPDARALAVLVAEALAVGLIVSVLEETWFRGALHSVIARAAGAAPAVGLTAVLFAAVHFVEPPEIPAGAVVWTSGLGAAAAAFGGVADPAVVDTFLALAAAGALLGLVRVHAGHIAGCIGMHAGWVVVIQVLREASDVDRAAPAAGAVGSFDGVIGYLACAWFALLAGAYHAWQRRARGRGVNPPARGGSQR